MSEIRIGNPLTPYTIADGATINPGELVAINAAGTVVPASDTAGLTVVGIAERVEDGMVEVRCGIIGITNDGTAPVTRAMRAAAVYIKDANTVAADATNKIPAGICVDVYEGTVYVDTTPAAIAAAKNAAAIAAAKNA